MLRFSLLRILALLAALMIGPTGCASSSSFSQLITDETITLAITSNLNQHDKQLLANNNLQILTTNSKVLLYGQATTEAQRQQIVQIAAATIDVKQVYNQIRIAPQLSFEQVSRDSWLTTKVKTSILNIKDIEPLHIKVVTEAAEVFLIGRVTRVEGDKLAEAARYVVGVNKVIKVFEYQ